MNKILLIFLSIVFLITSCDDLIDPAIENNRGLDDMYEEAEYAQGILLNAYTRLPNSSWTFNDVATDDAVTNDVDNNYLKIATGQWTAIFNPLDQWRNSKAAIQYLNIFLAEVDKVTWAKDENVSELFRKRLKGEAYGLRALYMYYLLQAHGGESNNGELLGVSIILDPEDQYSDFNQPRATFEACMQQLYSDISKAEQLLPLDFEEATALPSGYDNLDDYNRVFGDFARQRVSGRIVKFVKAQAALLAASPAYSSGNTTTWADAANYAGDLLTMNNGINGIDPIGLTWYKNSEINTLGTGINPAEIVWRTDVADSNSLELDHFPPTVYGSGRINPTQNIVDAFPMANGYPISDANSNYDPLNPYTDRDPRLKLYVLVNGDVAGVNNTVINTAADGSTNDALNKVETSTRTGYYLKKLLRQDVNTAPATQNQQKHYKPRMRYTELYLIYAEAANEAWGPMATGGSASFSAYDVIAAIRERAGITQPDMYLESIKADQAAMRELIRNERRLELCFEGFRFWDLRRWNKDLTETAKGVSIQGGAYQFINVENRLYDDYMKYGPIPYSEIIKFDALKQNKGW